MTPEMSHGLTFGSSAVVAGVSALAAQQVLTSDQQFIIDLVKAVSPAIGVVAVGAVGAWFAARAAKKADVVVNKVDALSKSIDGQLDEFKRLWQSEARLQGREEQRQEADAQKVVDAATTRQDAKEDRAEGMAVMTAVPPQAVIPVETRVEAAAAAAEEVEPAVKKGRVQKK